MEEANLLILARLLSMAALIAATIQYIEALKRRSSRRLADAERADLESTGLAGLVRLFLAEGGTARMRESKPLRRYP
ncbi:MAG: hypothetical protein ABI864_02015 [Chloroflexota bacterium]